MIHNKLLIGNPSSFMQHKLSEDIVSSLIGLPIGAENDICENIRSIVM